MGGGSESLKKKAPPLGAWPSPGRRWPAPRWRETFALSSRLPNRHWRARSPPIPSFSFFKPKTAYEITYGDWSSDVCSSDLGRLEVAGPAHGHLELVGLELEQQVHGG